MESLLINPLSRWLFDNGVTGNAQVTITTFDVSARPPRLECTLPDAKEDASHE